MESGDGFHLPSLSNQLQQTNQVSQRAEFKSLHERHVGPAFGPATDLFDLFFALRQKRFCCVLVLKSKYLVDQSTIIRPGSIFKSTLLKFQCFLWTTYLTVSYFVLFFFCFFFLNCEVVLRFCLFDYVPF